jgi:TonB family protein
MRSSIAVLALPAALLFQIGAGAQYRCDCTTVVDTCNATVSAHGTWLEIKTDRQECARVDYFVDGQPFVSLAVDGEDREDWLARTTSPRILVQSCQVCSAAGAEAPRQSATSPPAANEDEGGLRPIIASTPQYPAAARARGLSGHVDVEFTVTPAGTVENAHVTASEPRGVFDAAALAAVARWRYLPDPERKAQVVTESIAFTPPAATESSPLAPGADQGPRNQCLREDVTYNYGEMVDVGLVNACGEPLLVYGCAQGTGKNVGRWICADSEQRNEILVAAGDRRVGTPYNGSDVRAYTFADTFSLTRAPNSEIWWLACGVNDMSCRAEAEQWIRAMSGQSASVDPQRRSPVELARSY